MPTAGTKAVYVILWMFEIFCSQERGVLGGQKCLLTFWIYRGDLVQARAPPAPTTLASL